MDSDFYQAFKDRLKVKGYPTLLVTLPDGTEVMRLSGYSNEYEVGYMLKLRESVASREKAMEVRRNAYPVRLPLPGPTKRGGGWLMPVSTRQTPTC